MRGKNARQRLRGLGRPAIGAVTIILLWLAVQASWPAPVAGQSATGGWDPPINLSNTTTHSQTPAIAADPSGRVHVVWSEEVESDQGAIYYSRLEGERWTPPVDVILAPGGGIPAPALTADPEGYLHMAWGSGGSLYYSRAYAPVAGSARGWSEPRPLLVPQTNMGAPDIEASSAETVYVAYTEQIGEASGVYLIRSTDGGQQWGVPQLVHGNPRTDRMVDRARLAIAPDGTLHVVWVESNYPETFPPLGIRYASSHDGGYTWSEALSLADGPYDWPEVIVRGQDEVHVVWSGTGSDRYKFHRWSGDGGASWFPVWRNTALGGLQGWPALVVDGDQTLHWIQVGDVFGLPPDNATPDKVYYQYWLDGSWSEGVIMLSGFTERNNLNFVAAVVALGRDLHVVVQVPLPVSNTYQWEIFWLHRTLDARGIPPRALAAPTARPTATPVVSTPTATAKTETPTSVSTPAVFGITPPPVTGSAWSPLLPGLAAVVILCAVTLVAVTLRRRR